MSLIKQTQFPPLMQFESVSAINEMEILSDSGSTLSASPASSGSTRNGPKRGRPRLTEDTELAKQVRLYSLTCKKEILIIRNDGLSYEMRSAD